jgi:hypothetical protein
MAEATDGSAGGLQAFLDWAGEKGEMNASTAQALKSSAGKVVEASDDGLDTDISSLDVENLLSRWETKNKTKYKPDSLNTYKVRFRQAVAMYKAWLANDPDWKAAGKTANAGTPSVPRQRRTNGGPKKPAVKSASAAPSEVAAEASSHIAGPRLVSYDLPLRPDLLVRLNLPVDLTKDDAARISAFVSSLAFSSSPTEASAGAE